MKKRILSLFLALAMMTGSAGMYSSDVYAASNVAQGKTVTASTVEVLVPDNTADKVADGSTDTRWSSEKMKETGITDADAQTAQWLVMDLSAEKTTVSEIKVSFFKKVWATKYQIQTADTNTDTTEWETVKSVERASGSLSDNPVDTFTDVTSFSPIFHSL